MLTLRIILLATCPQRLLGIVCWKLSFPTQLPNGLSRNWSILITHFLASLQCFIISLGFRKCFSTHWTSKTKLWSKWELIKESDLTVTEEWKGAELPQRGTKEGKWEKNLPASAGDSGDMVLIPGSGWSLGLGNGNPFLHSCLENSVDRGARQAIGHEVSESDTTEHTHVCGKSVPQMLVWKNAWTEWIKRMI